MQYDVIILGAGAAGMFAAIEAGRRGRRVLVIDHAPKAGEKIRISGGGRCNFTNLSTAPERFLSANPRFGLSALRRYTPQDFIARIEAAGIAWHEKALGQLFCDGSAKQIVDMLLSDMAKCGVTLWLGTKVHAIEPGFHVTTDRGALRAESVVVATGGKSIPKIGASGFGYQIAERFGLALRETRPALVPLTFAEQSLERLRPLAGVALPSRIRSGRTSFDEALLFTHRGLSGPAILQVSSYWREGNPISVDLAPGLELAAWIRGQPGKTAVHNALARLIPEKLARMVVEDAGLSGNTADQSKASVAALASRLHGWHLTPVGTEGYRTAEVTLGGVDTDGLDARTMEAKTVPGLYFVGEVVDVTGWLGGYNFQWAWSSGWAAGQVA